MMANPMNMNPRKAMVGPITVRRTEKMSASKLSTVVDDPSMSRNPITIAAPAAAMSMKLGRVRGMDDCSSLSSSPRLGVDDAVEYFLAIVMVLMEHFVV